mmetsp:Transcript_6889/g.25717  ORF Transcript_6889/g.25717 Transcript_6889/m.25717 type:complete len:311 (-) Transcript_6889:1095-2027(-)
MLSLLLFARFWNNLSLDEKLVCLCDVNPHIGSHLSLTWIHQTLHVALGMTCKMVSVTCNLSYPYALLGAFQVLVWEVGLVNLGECSRTVFDVLGWYTLHTRSRCSWSRVKLRNVQCLKFVLVTQCQGLLVILFRLSWESTDDVGTQRNVWHVLTEIVYDCAEIGNSVLTLHVVEYLVVSCLHWNVQKGVHIGMVENFGHILQVILNIRRICHSHTHHNSIRKEVHKSIEQFGNVGANIDTVGASVLRGESNLLYSLSNHLFDTLSNLLHRPRGKISSGMLSLAVRALIEASHIHRNNLNVWIVTHLWESE